MRNSTLPDGCSQFDIDLHAGYYDEPEDERCPNCGADWDEACEPDCGLGCEPIEDDFWQRVDDEYAEWRDSQ